MLHLQVSLPIPFSTLFLYFFFVHLHSLNHLTREEKNTKPTLRLITMNSAERTTSGLLEFYQEHIQQVTELQHLVQQQYPPQHPDHDAATSYLNDRITLFRFLKKANYVLPEAYNLVEANVAWRIGSKCDRITPRDLEENPLWLNGLVQLRGQDRYGHPLITIRLGKYVPAPQQEYSDEGEADGEEKDRFLEYKQYIIFVLECTRKLLWESSRRQPPEEHALQATLILDLQGASVSDLDHQLITYTIELLKHRYPSCIAQGTPPCHALHLFLVLTVVIVVLNGRIVAITNTQNKNTVDRTDGLTTTQMMHARYTLFAGPCRT